MSRFLLAVALLFALGAPARPALYTLEPDGTGDFPTIQAAVDAAVEGDVVELAPGTYTGVGNRDIVFPDHPITLRSQDENPAACVIDCQGSPAEPHRAFLFTAGNYPDPQVRGITVTGGYQTQGGACYIGGASSALFRNMVFNANAAVQGGAIAVLDYGGPGISTCILSANSAESRGGALYLADSGGASMSSCTLLENTAGEDGGAIACVEDAAFNASFSVFSSNAALLSGGAVYLATSSYPYLAFCTLSGNSGRSAGGIGCGGSSLLSLTNSLVVFSAQGPAVEVFGSATATLGCCDLYGNAGGDWVGAIAGQLGEDFNMGRDPRFCATTPDLDRNWMLQTDSPCLPDSSGCADPMGALTTGCGDTPVERTSWGRLKARFR
jgi:predicted outer membrane repeat protein